MKANPDSRLVIHMPGGEDEIASARLLDAARAPTAGREAEIIM
jgi:hypothetical protein